MRISLEKAVHFIKESENILLLTHQSPDGDTLGSAFAFCICLQKLGKKARVECSDPIPKKYLFLKSGVEEQDFEPKTIIALDIADTQLFGEKLSVYADRVDLTIDHHPSNTFYSRYTLLDEKAAATAELVYLLIKALHVEISKEMAECIYTAVSTDTGCFKFSNTTSGTHRIAAEMIEKGIDYGEINRQMFEEKSRERLMLERLALESIEFYLNDKVALISITKDMRKSVNANEADFDGIQAIPRQIEGVEAGITIREKEPGVFKVSVRTRNAVDASAVCKAFGGGGHKRAAGCQVSGELNAFKKLLIDKIGEELGQKV